MLKWKLYGGDGRTPEPGAVVAPEERLTWPRTIGLGAQHVVAMFGATFVFPLIMGLDANLAIMTSGVATLIFLLVVREKVPSYLGTSAAFVGGVLLIRADGGSDADVTGAILIGGGALAFVGLIITLVGPRLIHRLLPPAVTGSVVMLIGFNLAPVVANNYWPQDQTVAIATMGFVVVASLLLRGIWGRVAIFLGLVFGFALSWVLDATRGPITSVVPGRNLTDADGRACAVEGLYCHALPFAHDRVDLSRASEVGWFGLPNFHAPSFHANFILLALPAVIALVAENAGHVKAVAEMTERDLNPYLGPALIADGVATAFASAVGSSPTTTYAENIGVMAATRIYSTAAYYVAAIVAIILGFVPKFGEFISATPGGVLGGITVVLYGMIGLLGAKIWRENNVDFGNAINLVPLAAGLIIALGNIEIRFSDSFAIGGISLGTIVSILGWHVARMVAPRVLRRSLNESLREDATFPEEHHGRHAMPEKPIEW